MPRTYLKKFHHHQSSSFSHSRRETRSDRVTWKEQELESGAPWLKCSPSVAILLAPQDMGGNYWKHPNCLAQLFHNNVVRLHVWRVFSMYLISHPPTFQWLTSSATRMAWTNSDCMAAANSKGIAFHEAQGCGWKVPFTEGWCTSYWAVVLVNCESTASDETSWNFNFTILQDNFGIFLAL